MDAGLAILLTALTAAVFTDLRRGRIPNLLVATGLLVGFAFHAIGVPGEGPLRSGGAIGLVSAAAGAGAGFAALFPLYALRAMGAGDVKLMMMVGAFLGPMDTLGAAVLTFVAGGVLALVMALKQRSLAQLFLNLHFVLTHSVVKAATGESVKFEPLQHTAGRMPYAVAIAAGTLLQLFLVRSGGWMLS